MILIQWHWTKEWPEHSVHGVQSAFAERKNVDNVERLSVRRAGGVENVDDEDTI